jgi:hypothetical protein
LPASSELEVGGARRGLARLCLHRSKGAAEPPWLQRGTTACWPMMKAFRYSTLEEMPWT